MDYEAIDRAASRAVVRLCYSDGRAPLFLADNASETATDIPANAKRFRDISSAWDACDRNRASFPDATLEAVSVVELWNMEAR
jgi:hypothetical protein